MTRVEFKLAMPGRNTWNGKWSGDDRNHTLLRTLDPMTAVSLDGGYWSYAWSDGWCARITARIVLEEPTEKSRASAATTGWSIASSATGDYADHERPAEVTAPVAREGATRWATNLAFN